MAALILTAGDAGMPIGDAYRIGTSVYAIGRSSGGWVQLVDETVSRTQCLLEYDKTTDVYYLSDRDSLNKTCINGIPISQRTILQDGDLITTGHVEIQFVYHEPPGTKLQDAIRDSSQSSIPTKPITTSPPRSSHP